MNCFILFVIVSLLVLAVFILSLHVYYQDKDWRQVMSYIHRYGIPTKLKEEKEV